MNEELWAVAYRASNSTDWIFQMTSFEVFQIVLGIVQFFATAAIGLVVYIQTERLKRSEMSSKAHESLNVLNSVALASPENLKAFDSFGRPETDDTDESRRKRWAAFVWLNALQVTFISNKHRLIDTHFAEQSLRQQLEIILCDDLVFWLLVHRGFHPDFVEFCRPIREEVAPDKPLEYSEAEAIVGISVKPESTPVTESAGG
jgi:hypothetical protein